MAESLSDVVIQQQLEISRYLVLIPFTILVYDYALTFRLEVERFWGTRLTWGTILVYVNRYLTLFGTVPVLAEVLLTTTDPGKAAICNASQEYHKYFALGSLVLVAVILIMRTYALYERNKYVLAFMLFVLFFAFVFALSMLLTGNRRDTLDPTLKSILCPSPTPHDSNIRTAAAWGGMLVFDIMIFSFTVYKALGHETRNGGLFSVLLRDGSMYFGIIIVANVANIVTYTSGGPIISGSGTAIVNALSSVMITRLMLNLRDPKILRRAQRNPTRNFTTTESYNYDSAAMSTLRRPYLDTEIVAGSMWMEEDVGHGGHESHVMSGRR